MTTDIQIYVGCMRDIRDRINKIQTRPGGVPMLDEESESLNFRKVIEALAYALLAANRPEYAVKHPDFIKHDKAKDILKNLEAINPACFPIPFHEPQETSP